MLCIALFFCLTYMTKYLGNFLLKKKKSIITKTSLS
jgi:hypothetical protein